MDFLRSDLCLFGLPSHKEQKTDQKNAKICSVGCQSLSTEDLLGKQTNEQSFTDALLMVVNLFVLCILRAFSNAPKNDLKRQINSTIWRNVEELMLK